MKNFGKIKTKILKTLTESFTNGEKDKVKNILQITKSDKDIKELYVLYEDIETKFIEDVDIAKLYVDELSTVLKNKFVTNTESWNKLVESVNGVESEENDLYNLLDLLSESDTLLNIDKKVIAKKRLVDHLTKPKEVSIQESVYTENEKLLQTVLVNNFNLVYSNTLTEEQQKELKNILSMSNDETKTKIDELKESTLNKINELIVENKDDSSLVTKLNGVISEITNMKVSKYNYYRLSELKNGL